MPTASSSVHILASRGASCRLWTLAAVGPRSRRGRARAALTRAGCRVGALRPWHSAVARAPMQRAAIVSGSGATCSRGPHRAARPWCCGGCSGARGGLLRAGPRPGGSLTWGMGSDPNVRHPDTTASHHKTLVSQFKDP